MTSSPYSGPANFWIDDSNQVYGSAVGSLAGTMSGNTFTGTASFFRHDYGPHHIFHFPVSGTYSNTASGATFDGQYSTDNSGSHVLYTRLQGKLSVWHERRGLGGDFVGGCSRIPGRGRPVRLASLFIGLFWLSACGHGDSAALPPPELSYNGSQPFPAVVGEAIALTPAVSGPIDRYAVSPALPPGLFAQSLDWRHFRQTDEGQRTRDLRRHCYQPGWPQYLFSGAERDRAAESSFIPQSGESCCGSGAHALAPKNLRNRRTLLL